MSTPPSYALAPLPAALAPPAWQQSAACRYDDRDLFFPPDKERGRYVAFREAAAKQICQSCPVTTECLDYALAADERHGVWGGLNTEQRARLRQRSRARGT